jgi:hypothetical protein
MGGSEPDYTSIFENRHAPAITNSAPTPSNTAKSRSTPKLRLSRRFRDRLERFEPG